MNQKPPAQYSIRKATADDIPLLVRHHSLMFREIRTLQGKTFPEESYTLMEESQAVKLNDEIPKGACHAWVVEDERREAAASGALSIYSFTSSLENPSYKGGYVHSIYTEKEHRGVKLSTLVMNEQISFCRSIGITRMLLIASEAGRPIYEALGFEPVPRMMYMDLR